ncbi:phenoloxidase subunit 1 [Culex quinquefasciatus]|uniref:Phenoloxidase subunit 1 n=1 Tax=Culex quinquefasciatus TaxID=7176 RepID=B0WT82_CULQU|nr:phenoloxidase subunit 1 [Culex quinquefasciatus]|eukprot:XP_001870839.1 phenoloxidase subunit 1 [Culex quinquefasciatus]
MHRRSSSVSQFGYKKQLSSVSVKSVTLCKLFSDDLECNRVGYHDGGIKLAGAAAASFGAHVPAENDGKTVIDVPDDFLTDRYRPIGADLQSRFSNDAEQRIPVRSVSPPDLSFADGIDRRGAFSLFILKHRDAAAALINLFMSQPDVQSLMSVATFCRDRLNPVLFQYGLAVAIQHRPDTKDVNIPSIVSLFPDQFVDPAVFPKLREEGSVVQQANRMVIDIKQNFTASDREEEQRMAYFREDIGVNMHHWHWHLVYPGDGPDSVVKKDRRGELFFYMHSQLIARYNMDRFCNQLASVKNFTNFRETIPEAYFPKMLRSSNNRSYPGRHRNIALQDVNRIDNGTIVQVNDLERWRDRILEAIDQGFVLDNSGNRIPLDEQKGIDVLGDVVEASKLSPNQRLYGSLHNMGHNLIAYIHDPDYRYLEDYGVMGDVTTAMRDPFFYRWHGMIDGIFRRFKDQLTPYPADQLQFPGVTVNSVSVQLTRANTPANVLLTYWQKSQVDLASGLDFGPEGNVFASFTHLQHAPFSFRVEVNNDSGAVKQGTLRIWLAPKVDERGTPLTFREQRQYFTEMDTSTVTLNPGVNTIVRRSDQSSVTIPYERTFRAVGTAATPKDENALAQFRFCGCGWPQHMLVPKGAPGPGVQFDIFAMVSDFSQDTVNQEFDPNAPCNDSHSFCGLRDKLYPDKRAMGYPFDRSTPATIATLQDFISPNSNMKTNTVQIKFSNTVIART